MERLSTEDLLKGYYKEICGGYSDLSIEDLKEVISCPFEVLKDEIESGKFRTVRFKYLGTFLVYTNRLRYSLFNIERQYKEGKVTEEVYKDVKGLLEGYLSTLES